MMTAATLLLTLQSGLFSCTKGPDICDQDVKVYRNGSGIIGLKVEYVGWCGSMGPYTYSCHQNYCTDGNVEFKIGTGNHYHWKNLGYLQECDFVSKK
jgi:hypothetical protein